MGDLGDAGSESGDDLRAERATDQSAQLVVARWVGQEQVARAEALRRRDHSGRVGGKHLRVGDHPRHVDIAEDVPDVVGIAPHRVLVAHLAQQAAGCDRRPGRSAGW